MRALSERVLRDAGYTVLSGADGGQALELASERAEAIDLALLDVVMPICSGPRVRDRLREAKPGIKVIFGSGYSEGLLQTDFVQAEGVLLIRKPYDREDLLRAVREALDASG